MSKVYNKLENEEEVTELLQPKQPKGLKPMHWILGSSTIINLVLATGPFSYPYPFVNSGIILAPLVMIVIMITAWMTATFLIEAISVSCAKKYNGRTNSIFMNPVN